MCVKHQGLRAKQHLTGQLWLVYLPVYPNHISSTGVGVGCRKVFLHTNIYWCQKQKNIQIYLYPVSETWAMDYGAEYKVSHNISKYMCYATLSMFPSNSILWK